MDLNLGTELGAETGSGTWIRNLGMETGLETGTSSDWTLDRPGLGTGNGTELETRIGAGIGTWI